MWWPPARSPLSLPPPPRGKPGSKSGLRAGPPLEAGSWVRTAPRLKNPQFQPPGHGVLGGQGNSWWPEQEALASAGGTSELVTGAHKWGALGAVPTLDLPQQAWNRTGSALFAVIEMVSLLRWLLCSATFPLTDIGMLLGFGCCCAHASTTSRVRAPSHTRDSTAEDTGRGRVDFEP